jgi:hypothetical protein
MKFRWGSSSNAAVLLALLLSSAGHASIIRMDLQVESINFDNFVTGLQAGDSLGYLEYDDANFLPAGGSTGGFGVAFWVTDLTGFSLSLGSSEYGLDDLSQGGVIYSTENLTGDPIISFEVDNPDIDFGAISQSTPLYRLSGHDPANPVPTAFSLDFSATVIPVPATVWLFASGLGLLGWFRRRQTA